MGKGGKKLPKQRRKVPMADRTRKLTKKGKLKRKKGDLKLVHSRNVSFEVKQKKGGQWMRTGDRKCNIHSVCDCVRRTDAVKQQRISNR